MLYNVVGMCVSGVVCVLSVWFACDVSCDVVCVACLCCLCACACMA